VLALLGAALASPVAAARPEAVGASTDIYIVVMADAPVVAYEGGVRGIPATQPAKGTKVDPNSGNVRKYAAHLDRQHRDVLAAAGAGADAIFYDYHYSLNGFAAVLTAVQAAKLSSNPAVVSVELDQLRQVTTDNSPTFLGLDAPGGLWDDLGGQGAAGEDVIVGVIDTGIWPEHPSFSDQLDLSDPEGASGSRNLAYGPPPADWHGTCQSGERFSQRDCNNKLIGARYFMEGMGRHGVGTAEYKSARDADGHGTHTASTAAGNAGVAAAIFGRPFGEVSGIAPRARVAAYKACWDVGCFITDLAAAIDAAVADGVDVINYSIGSDTPSINIPVPSDERSFLFAARAGVFVANSAGNAGPGAATVGSPSAVPWVTSVGASTQDRTFEATATLGGGASVTGASVTEGVASSPLVDAEAAPAAGVDADDAELCLAGSLNPAAVTGKVVLCLRGVNARVEKSEVVADAGGVGMILYNPDDIMALVTDNHWVPSVHINFTDGTTVKAYAATPGATAAISPGQAVSAPGSVMADFSSRGENGAAEDIIKPDVTAPGVNILAGNTPTPFDSRPGELFQSISGTSMSSPHVAGVAALLRDLHPDWDPEYIKSALMTTGRQDVVKEDGFTPADPFDMGGGHIVPNSAADPGLVYDTGFNQYVAFLCGMGVFAPTSATCVAFGSIDPSNLNLPSIGVGSLIGTQTVTRTVTSVAPGTTTWHASIEGLAGYSVTLPADFSLATGASQPFEVSFTRTTAPIEEWVFGSLVLTSGGYTVRSPVALRASLIDAPDTVDETTTTSDGSLTWDVQVGYAGSLSATGYGLVPDAVTAGLEVAQDPDQDVETDTFTSGVFFKDFTLAGAQYLAGGTRGATTEAGSDLDVFLFFEGEDGETGFSFDDLVAFSADADSEEIVELVHPQDGNYRLLIHGWGTPDGASSFSLHEWVVDDTTPDDAAFEAHAKDVDPAAVDTGEVVPITANFTGVTSVGTQYRGVVDYSDGTSVIGSTVVQLNR
jgi:subtilisin family serine protease